jgi:hypothetical protein
MRTGEEVKAYHRKLLPADSTKHGLMGWWSMEEGKGDHLYDVTESRYRIPIERENMKWTTQVRPCAEAH